MSSPALDVPSRMEDFSRIGSKVFPERHFVRFDTLKVKGRGWFANLGTAGMSVSSSPTTRRDGDCGAGSDDELLLPTMHVDNIINGRDIEWDGYHGLGSEWFTEVTLHPLMLLTIMIMMMLLMRTMIVILWSG
uniref:Uncharacterized protein n=1 Tax=Anopheles culicifacies TaxID=139723 RepID=A0A182MH62_9DIPT